ncbi:PAS domain S-box protein (plasmid) [Ensifer sp. PDNC004]|uniref:PAS domain S-box protein n=1 Tax=Ensifer sp. PDNC004 TaxID=2811423 RepID=UPI0019650D62|nr:PAS domain S-box protein [Ensifer sp. PDNC004]QRY70730.1 PAS domain S-box protein [Ensifer sp. PDNC004]
MPLGSFDKEGSEDILRARLAAIVESSFDAIVSKDLDGTVRTWNGAAERMFGYPAEQMVGQSILTIIPSHLHGEERELLQRLRKGERIEPFETVRQRKDGSYITVSLTISPIRNAKGRIIGASKVARDITAAKDRERRIRLLLREVNHRVKNHYAIILSMIRQSRSEDTEPAVFQKDLENRIWALSASHDLIASADWQATDLRGLVEKQIAAFHAEAFCRISGPGIALAPAAIENLGMAIHELALHSSKGGVLRMGDGTISITWALATSPAGLAFSMIWDEHLGSKDCNYQLPHSGFGAVVLKRTVPQALNAKVESAHGDGFARWRLVGPAERFLEVPRVSL